MRFNFICHPYHRGGVTSWMKNAFIESQNLFLKGSFITVLPKKAFISSGSRPLMVDFLDFHQNIFFGKVGFEFELGSLAYRAAIYRELILKYSKPGEILIPSDDEACWMACCQVSDIYRVIGVIHSDEVGFFNLYNKYKAYLAGAVSVSKRIRKNVVNPNDKLPHEVIPCGIPIQNFLSISSRKDKFAWIGRIEEESKRVSDIIPIAKKVHEYGQRWSIHVFGDGEPLEKLKEISKKERIDTTLIFHGWTSEKKIKEELSTSKILIQTSNFEGMSLVVMEALASGCLIVSSKVSGVEDLLDDPESNEIVYLYEVGDINHAFDQLKLAFSNFNEDNSRKAVSLAKKHYSISSCLNRYENFASKLNFSSFAMRREWLLNRVFSFFLATFRFLKYRLELKLRAFIN